MPAELAAHNLTNYLWATAPPFSAVVLAAGITFTYTYFFNVRTARNDIFKDYNADLIEIEALCRDYWLGDHQAADAEKKHELDNIGHELRNKLDAFMRLREQYPLPLKKEILSRHKDLETDLFMKATGDKFQSSDIKACPETYADICTTIYEMKALIRTVRSRRKISRRR